MPSVLYRVRHTEFEIHFRDHGYEPDTNAHDIDWHVIDAWIATAPFDYNAHNLQCVPLTAGDLTEEEVESLEMYLRGMSDSDGSEYLID